MSVVAASTNLKLDCTMLLQPVGTNPLLCRRHQSARQLLALTSAVILIVSRRAGQRNCAHKGCATKSCRAYSSSNYSYASWELNMKNRWRYGRSCEASIWVDTIALLLHFSQALTLLLIILSVIDSPMFVVAHVRCTGVIHGYDPAVAGIHTSHTRRQPPRHSRSC